MTREQKIDAFTMKLDGCSYEEIGRKHTVSVELLKKMFSTVLEDVSVGWMTENIVYQGIRKWIQERDMPISEFANLVYINDHVNSGTMTRFRRKLLGAYPFNQHEIEMILTATGMTFDEAFTRGIMA